MELNGLDLFKKVLNTLNLNSVILKKDGSNLELVDNHFRHRLYEGFSYRESMELFRNLSGETTVIKHTDNFFFTYLLLHIPEEYLAEDETSILTIGPFTERRPGPEEVYQIMLDNHIPERLLLDVCSFYDTIPSMENAPSQETTLLSLSSGLFGREYHLEQLPADSVLFHNSSNIFSTVKDNPQIAKDSIAERYEVENELMAAISAGDYNKARGLYGKLLSYHIRPRTENPFRNQQHFTIILNTLCRKAVELGGVHPLYIDDLSTRFAVLINEMNSFSDISALIGEMIHKYCLLVKNYAMKGYSAVVKEIISYIDFHYTENLSLNRFANMFNMSKTYLSNLFKKETGTTLTDFIHQVRMRKAITLINSSALPITAIATACGYNDINYFIRIFKRTYGLSPKQYQKTVMRAGH